MSHDREILDPRLYGSFIIPAIGNRYQTQEVRPSATSLDRIASQSSIAEPFIIPRSSTELGYLPGKQCLGLGIFKGKLLKYP
jgi:hypothetical protein